jgi:predicted transcriptional regulator
MKRPRTPRLSNVTPPPALHELETEIMEEVWVSGEVTVHDVRRTLNGRSGKERAYSTVMTVMSRLCGKGLLRKERRGRSDYYVAVLSREEYLSARAETEVKSVVSAYGDLALVHFAAHMAKLEPARRKQLRRLAEGD